MVLGRRIINRFLKGFRSAKAGWKLSNVKKECLLEEYVKYAID